MFYNKSVEVWSKGEDEDLGGGLIVPGEPSFLYKTNVDVQPYSSAEARKDYGYDTVVTNAMFMDVKDISIGKSIVKYRENSYEVKEIIEWDDYLEVLLERV